MRVQEREYEGPEVGMRVQVERVYEGPEVGVG